MKLKKLMVTTAFMTVFILAIGSCKKQTDTATVTFDANGGTFTLHDNKPCIDTTVDIGSVTNKPENPVRQDYAFGGWYTDATLQEAYDFTAPVNRNSHLFACWKRMVATVTFDAKGGSFTLHDNKSCIDTTVDIGSVVNKPDTPVRLGYTFEGWCTDASLETAYNFATPVENDLCLFADWRQEGETEKYNTNGDSEHLY